MANSTWRSWISNLKSRARPATKRINRDCGRWELASERLEERALLSAVTASAPVPAETSHGKAAFAFPNVAGTWNVAIVGLGTGTATLTQDGTKVSGTINVQGFPEINASGKFTKKHPHSLIGKTKLNLPEVGRVVVRSEINFADVPNPTTFTGQTSALGQNFAIQGTKV